MRFADYADNRRNRSREGGDKLEMGSFPNFEIVLPVPLFSSKTFF